MLQLCQHWLAVIGHKAFGRASKQEQQGKQWQDSTDLYGMSAGDITKAAPEHGSSNLVMCWCGHTFFCHCCCLAALPVLLVSCCKACTSAAAGAQLCGCQAVCAQHRACSGASCLQGCTWSTRTSRATGVLLGRPSVPQGRPCTWTQWRWPTTQPLSWVQACASIRDCW